MNTEESLNEVQPFFDANSFKKQGKNWYKGFEEFGWCFNLQSSLYNNQDEIRFTFNLGIFVGKPYKFVYQEHSPTFPKEIHCVIRKRTGVLKNRSDTWYTINNDTDIEQLELIIQHDLECVALP